MSGTAIDARWALSHLLSRRIRTPSPAPVSLSSGGETIKQTDSLPGECWTIASRATATRQSDHAHSLPNLLSSAPNDEHPETRATHSFSRWASNRDGGVDKPA